MQTCNTEPYMHDGLTCSERLKQRMPFELRKRPPGILFDKKPGNFGKRGLRRQDLIQLLGVQWWSITIV